MKYYKLSLSPSPKDRGTVNIGLAYSYLISPIDNKKHPYSASYDYLTATLDSKPTKNQVVLRGLVPAYHKKFINKCRDADITGAKFYPLYGVLNNVIPVDEWFVLGSHSTVNVEFESIYNSDYYTLCPTTKCAIRTALSPDQSSTKKLKLTSRPLTDVCVVSNIFLPTYRIVSEKFLNLLIKCNVRITQYDLDNPVELP